MSVNSNKNRQLPSFDELVQLAKTDPKAFEQLKKNMCTECIQSSSPKMQKRLQAQQSHIDLIISRSKNPIHANVLLRKELLSQFQKFREALSGETVELKDAEVVTFRPRDETWR